MAVGKVLPPERILKGEEAAAEPVSVKRPLESIRTRSTELVPMTIGEALFVNSSNPPDFPPTTQRVLAVYIPDGEKLELV